MAARRPLTRKRGAIPAALAALIVLGSTCGAWATSRALRRERRHVAPAVAFAESAAVSAAIQTDGALLATARRSMSGVPRLSADLAALAGQDPGVAMGIGRVVTGGGVIYTSPGSSTLGASDALNGQDLAARPDWRVALDLARDSAQPVVAVDSVATGAPVVMQAVALYGPALAPTEISDRRRDLVGYVVLLRPPSSLVAAVPGAGSRVAVQLSAPEGVLGGLRVGPGERPPPSASAEQVSANGAHWVVRAWSTGPPSRLPWVVLIGGLALAAVGAAVVAVGETESSRLARAATARSNELSLVARTGPLLQQSLELGELVPLFVVEISDELGLEGVAISLVSDAGRLVRLFSIGLADASTSLDPADLGEPPASVPPGGVITVPLQRAGRIVGALSARAGHGLDPSQTETLRAVCDLLAAALGNARLLQDEQAMVAQLRDLDRLKTTFLGSVSHDLRTSVTAIEGFATLLATHAASFDDEQRRDFLQRIERNARSLGVMVEDLLDFARLERSGASVTLQPVDLSDLVPKVVDQMYSILGDRPMSVDIAPGVVARADPAAIERIVVNLLSNAAKYTPDGSEVTISLEEDHTTAIISISDRGRGIPVAERGRIFERFYRIDNEDAIQVRGVGIGLALVRQLVELQQGTITVDDAPGGGARFRVKVPIEAHQADRGKAVHVQAP